MYSKKEEDKASKFISYILRHGKDDIALQMDDNGWVNVNEFISKSNLYEKNDIKFNKELLKQVVVNNDKQRFAFNEDETRIRANQGHTLEVELDLPFVEPPEFLYHGTVAKNLPSILVEGLKPMERHDVHLSFDIKVAKSVGARYGKPIILKIKAKEMFVNGFKFQCTKNNVWLTKLVDPDYIEVLE